MNLNRRRIVILGPNTSWVHQDVELLKSEGFDVIHIEDNILQIFRNIFNIINSDIILEWFAYPLGSFLGKALNKKVILNAIGWELFKFGFAQNTWRRFLVKLGLKNADIVIAISNKSLRLAKEYYIHKNMKTIYEGIDTEKFAHLRSNFKINKLYNKQIVSITFLDITHIARKDLITLVESVRYIKDIYPEIQLIIVGRTTEDVNYLLDIAKRLNVLDNIEFTGFIDNSRLINILNNSNLFVLPSLYEGFPTVLCEALSCGMPIITTNRPAMDEIFKNSVHAVMIVPRNPKLLAEAIIDLLQNPAKGLKLSINGRKLIERKYSKKIRAKKLKILIEKLLSRSDRPESGVDNYKFINAPIYLLLFILALVTLYIDRKRVKFNTRNINELIDEFLSV